MTLAIYGPGGFGRELLTAARREEGILFISDDPHEIDTEIEGVPVRSLASLVESGVGVSNTLRPDDPLWVVIAVAGSLIRRELASKVSDAGLAPGA